MPPQITYTTADIKALTDVVSGYTKLAQRAAGAFTSVGNPAWYTYYDDENASADLGDLILRPDSGTGFWVVAGDRTYYGSGAPPTLPLTTTTMNALGSFRWIDTTTGTVYDYAGAVGWLISIVGGLGQVATSGLVARYDFTEGSGTTVTDRSGNGRNGTFVGSLAWSTQYRGRGLEFNGGYVDLSRPSDPWITTGAVTLEAVVLFRAVVEWGRVFDVLTSTNSNSIALATSSFSTGLPVAFVGTPSDQIQLYKTATTIARWRYLAFTYGSGTLDLFEERQTVSSTSIGGSIANANRTIAYLGLTPYPEASRANMIMAEFRLYDRVLSNSELNMNYLATRQVMLSHGIVI